MEKWPRHYIICHDINMKIMFSNKYKKYFRNCLLKIIKTSNFWKKIVLGFNFPQYIEGCNMWLYYYAGTTQTIVWKIHNVLALELITNHIDYKMLKRVQRLCCPCENPQSHPQLACEIPNMSQDAFSGGSFTCEVRCTGLALEHGLSFFCNLSNLFTFLQNKTGISFSWQMMKESSFSLYWWT